MAKYTVYHDLWRSIANRQWNVNILVPLFIFKEKKTIKGSKMCMKS